MGHQIPVHDAWKEQLIATRTVTGQIYLLLSVEKRACENCRYGTVFETVWGAPSGEMQRIIWCTTCFNADCDPTEPDEGAYRAWNRLVQRMNQEPNLTCWNGAKAAIEELERQALI
jgi:hypothetical protein